MFEWVERHESNNIKYKKHSLLERILQAICKYRLTLLSIKSDTIINKNLYENFTFAVNFCHMLAAVRMARYHPLIIIIQRMRIARNEEYSHQSNKT